jgi:c-di-GMP-binding flagellar brake protein YcgR
MAALSSANADWRATMNELVRRNGPVEAALLTDAGQPRLLSVRVRVLEFSNRIVLEQPTGERAGHGLPHGCRVRVAAFSRGQRWEFITSVVAVIDFQLNERNSVPAAVLAMPAEVIDAQRRQHFRVDVHGLDLPAARLHPMINGSRAGSALAGTIINLSAGGMGIVTSRKAEDLCLGCRDFHCIVQLPDPARLLEVDAQLVNMQELDAVNIYLGLRFQAGEGLAGRRLSDRIRRIVVDLQRRQLARRRQLLSQRAA